MHPTQAIILGVIEGITEFLPVSSTFHLIFSSQFLGLKQDEFVKLFEVFIQAGAIMAVICLYWKELISNRELVKKIIISFVPTAVIGFILYKVIKDVFFEANFLMIGVFIFVGLIFIFAERAFKSRSSQLKNNEQLTVKDAIVVGIVQALAVVPGVSRAGAVILGMMFLRYKREEAAKYSFLLAIPTILAASALDLYKGRDYVLQQGSNILLLVIGFITAFIVAYIIINWFINFLKHHSLEIFGLYRIVLGIIILLILFMSP